MSERNPAVPNPGHEKSAADAGREAGQARPGESPPAPDPGTPPEKPTVLPPRPRGPRPPQVSVETGDEGDNDFEIDIRIVIRPGGKRKSEQPELGGSRWGTCHGSLCEGCGVTKHGSLCEGSCATCASQCGSCHGTDCGDTCNGGESCVEDCPSYPCASVRTCNTWRC
jgi:hypothetical protein